MQEELAAHKTVPEPAVVAMPQQQADFWRYASAIGLTAQESLIAIWAHTHPNAGLLGCFLAPMREIGGGTLSLDEIRVALARLDALGIVHYDPENLHLWAAFRPEWSLALRGGNLKATDLRAVNIARAWQRIPSKRLRDDILRRYGARIGLNCNGVLA